LQIIFNPFEINACAKLFAPKSSRMVRFDPENHRKIPVFAHKKPPKHRSTAFPLTPLTRAPRG